ncbi:hypothetical protein ONE63_001863 [Megalurothrips usitatus]|uniref:Trichohyalin-like n=1 Tax=Megalurothrips usitatus TaxID=439358 RepID=A0AAV7XDQ3_9NEOP|nr:hypothetical protein ONE63_001863 [Megalurothrips usitatus]
MAALAALAVPEHDRRILESMAMKKRQEWRREDLAHRAHLQWERERRQRHQMEQERAARWKASVNARREWEAKENARRMEAVKRSLRLAQQRLEEAIRLKEERVQLRVLEEDVHRMVLQGERSKEYAARRLEVEEKLLHIREGARTYRRLLDAELQSRQAQADRRREHAKEQERLVGGGGRSGGHLSLCLSVSLSLSLTLSACAAQRAASANREWERCRVERTTLLELQAEESGRALRASARERHQRAASNKSRIRRRRQQRALHEGRRRAQRREVRDKDQRIRQLRRLRERALQESREQAYATASLREELRRSGPGRAAAIHLVPDST